MSWSVCLSFFSFLFFLFLYHVFIVMVQELACSTSYGVNKTLISESKKQVKIYKIISKGCQVLDMSPSHGEPTKG